MTLKRTKCLDDAISNNYVIRSSKDMLAYNQYWYYCREKRLPFIVIDWKSPNKHAKFIIDNLTVGIGLLANTIKEITELFDSVYRKGKSLSIVDPIRSQISSIKTEDAEKIARAAYSFAISDENRLRLLNLPSEEGPDSTDDTQED